MTKIVYQRTSPAQRREIEQFDAAALEQYQVGLLAKLLDDILPQNEFYRGKLGDLQRPTESLEQLSDFPFTLSLIHI